MTKNSPETSAGPFVGKRTRWLAKFAGYFPLEQVAAYEPYWFATISLGIVLTTFLAAVSGFAFAHEVFRLGGLSYIWAIAWAMLILVVDLMIVRQPPRAGLRGGTAFGAFLKAVTILVLRGLLSLVVAWLVAEPLLLIIFRDAVTREIRIDNQPRVDALAAREYQVAADSAVRASAKTSSLQRQIVSERNDLDRQYADIKAELKSGSATSLNQPGPGPEYRTKVAAYQAAVTTHLATIDLCRGARAIAANDIREINSAADLRVASIRDRIEDPKTWTYLTQQAALASIESPAAADILNSRVARARAEYRLGRAESDLMPCADQAEMPVVQVESFIPPDRFDAPNSFSLVERTVVRQRHALVAALFLLVDLLPLTTKYLSAGTPNSFRIRTGHVVEMADRRIREEEARATFLRRYRDFRDIEREVNFSGLMHDERLRRIRRRWDVLRTGLTGWTQKRQVSPASDRAAQSRSGERSGVTIGSWVLLRPAAFHNPDRYADFWIVRGLDDEYSARGEFVMKIFTSDDTHELDIARLIARSPANRRGSVAAVVDAGKLAPDRHYIVSELFPDGTLHTAFGKQFSRPLEDGLAIIERVLYGLDHASRHLAIHHGDVKPANIVISRADAEGYLIDWGTAHYAKNPTIRGGTFWFAAPEVWTGRVIHSSLIDLYGVGATLYWYVTGLYPLWDVALGEFSGKRRSNKRVMEFLKRGLVPTPINDLLAPSAQLPKELAALVDRWVSPMPTDRVESALDRLPASSYASSLDDARVALRRSMEQNEGLIERLVVGPAWLKGRQDV